MADSSEEENCVALTQSGNRCSRLAKQGRFCFQHAKMDDVELVEGVNPESEGIISVVSSGFGTRAAHLSGVQRDVGQNIEQIVDEAGSIVEAFRSTDLGGALDAFKNTVGKTGASAGKGAVIGGTLGSPFGPVGIAAGATAGGWFGVYRGLQDKRAVAVTVVPEAPEEAPVIPSTHDDIADVRPIQLAIQSAIDREEGDQEWIRNTLTREWDMEAVEEALDNLEQYDSEEGLTGYYLQHEEDDQQYTLALIFGTRENE